MREKYFFFSFTCLLLGLAIAAPGTSSQAKKETIKIKGLSRPVEIIKDHWGISHIYAQSQKDLFFAQGFNAARDRLFQFEIWRRRATGTLAEILGPQALKRDIGARLLKARVDLKRELNHYHPQGEEIITSFCQGINSYIDLTNENPELLPLEFGLLGIRPGYWTPEVVISRHNGLFRNARQEVAMLKIVNTLGVEKTRNLLNLHPGNPSLKIDGKIDSSVIPDEILELYIASRSRIKFSPDDIVNSAFRAETNKDHYPVLAPSLIEQSRADKSRGSNNWVVSGRFTFTGFPMMANDPHRSQQIPSLRYWAHLNAPGWNVIGGGEPALPGISIGHNEFGAWGLTIFSIDQEDLYIYETNPSNPNQYLYQGKWKNMHIIEETIPVKGAKDRVVDLKYTHHGPVLHEDRENNKAYALQASWLEIGGAPYLASLRMDQAKSWEEFREACQFSMTPSENMVWADKGGNIGWQAVGITPIRKNWSGLLPVPGDGRYEWKGFLPIRELPHTYNPPEGYFATANQDNLPKGYPHIIGFMWTDPFRYSRIEEVLSSGRKFTLMDMMELQHDELSIPARALIPLLRGLFSSDARAEKARKMLLDWDYVMRADSVEPAIYSSWERNLSESVWNLHLPEQVQSIFSRRSLKKMIDFVTAPDGHFGPDPIKGRDDILIEGLEEGIKKLTESLGPDMSKWQYGQDKYHHIKIRHILSDAVNKELKAKLDVGPYPRGGNGFTVNMTTSNLNQTSGGSFRIVADLENWDNSIGTNSPGQSGNPDSPHYSDLIEPWSKGKYFPIFFSREKIESAVESIIVLKPINPKLAP